MTSSTIITAAGKNSRMRKDQLSRNIELKNKLILPFKDKTVIETTIDNALSANVDECIVVLGHYANEIMEAIFDNPSFTKEEVVASIKRFIPNFEHEENA